MRPTSQLKKFAGESLVYGVSGILTRFISVFLVPVYTRIFAPSDYGVIGLVVTASALLNILLILGLDNSMARWYYDGDNELDRKITLNTFLWSCIAIAVVFAGLLIGLRDFIAVNIIREPVTAPLLLLAGVNLPLAVFSVFTTNVLRVQRRAVATVVFTLVTSLTNIALNILFVIILRWGISGIFYAQIISSIVACAGTFVLFRREIAPRLFNIARWREMAVFSLPLVPGSIAFWVVNLSGAYFLQLMNSTRDAGLFYIGASIASVLAMFTGGFQMAWGPFAYSIYKRPEAKQVYAQVLLVFLTVAGLLSLGLMLFAREILMVFTTMEYADAAWVAGLLGFNHILIGLSYIASIGTGITKNNRAFGMAMLASAGILVGLNLLLVPRFGKEGAAISILLSQALVPIAVFAHAQKLYPIPYKFGKSVFIFTTSFVLGVAGIVALKFLPLSSAAEFGIKVLLILFYCACVYPVMRNEIARIVISPDDASAA